MAVAQLTISSAWGGRGVRYRIGVTGICPSLLSPSVSIFEIFSNKKLSENGDVTQSSCYAWVVRTGLQRRS